MEKRNEKFIALTALWAFVESGLGGMMHALHLPFTGIFLGGFSVLSIYLIAYYEKKVFTQVMKATLIVMAVKASVNPATPPTAYIAVLFQGFVGASLLGISVSNRILPLLFALLAMLESAFQKLLVLTLIFGTSWYTALDKFFHSILKSLSLRDDVPYAIIVVSIYLGIYCIWGLILGVWINRLPLQILSRLNHYNHIEPADHEPFQKKQKSNKKLINLSILAIILFLSCFLIPDKNPWVEALTLVVRTASIVVLWLVIFLPLWKRLLSKIRSKKFEETPMIMDRLPYLRSMVRPLYKEISGQYKGWRKWKEFVLGLMVISLRDYGNETDVHSL